MRVVVRSVAAVLVVAYLVEGSLAEEWPQWRGPNRDSTSPQKVLSKDWGKHPPRELWKANVGIGFSSIAVSGGLAFTIGNKDATDTVYAFDAGTGAAKWKHSYACPLKPLRHEGGPYATPTVDAGKVYTLSKVGHLFCFEAATGRVVWQKDIVRHTRSEPPRYGLSSSPLVGKRLLILNVGGAGAAVDKATGRVVWRSDGKPGHASPFPFALGRQRGVAILTEEHLVGVDPANGRVLWRQELPRSGLSYKIADPLFLGDRVFLTASYGGLCALFRITDGGVARVWKTRNLVSKVLNPVLVDGHIVGGHQEKSFRCIDPANGELKWEKPFAGNVLVTDGACLVLTTTGELILAEVSGASFKELARKQVVRGKCWTPPALAGGRVYCRSAKGDVVCVDLSSKERP